MTTNTNQPIPNANTGIKSRQYPLSRVNPCTVMDQSGQPVAY
jgi:hypothetical protein